MGGRFEGVLAVLVVFYEGVYAPHEGSDAELTQEIQGLVACGD